MFKKLSIISILFVLLSCFIYSPVYAKNTNYFKDPGYYDYTGKIGESKISLSVYCSNGKFKGTYIYNKYRKPIDIDGRLVGANKIVLYEYDKNHKVTATFSGTINRDERITGVWKDSKATKKYKFKLQEHSLIFREKYGYRFDLDRKIKDSFVVKYVEQIQNYIRNDDAVNVSKLIYYPITATIDGKRVEIKGQQQFIENYNKIFTTEFKNTILEAYAPYLFVNWQGIMVCPLDGGMCNIWIDYSREGKEVSFFIKAINN